MADFSLISILDSNNREVFINPTKLFPISYDGYPYVTDVIEITFSNNENTQRRIDDILINGEPLELNNGKTYTITNVDNNEDYYFLFFMKNLIDLEFDYEVKIHYHSVERGVVMDSDTDYFFGKVFATTKAVANSTQYFNQSGTCLTDTNSSFQLIRTNPKLSGNIKLVVTSDGNLYLDTFKVSDNLFKSTYRHKTVSAMSNFNTDVRNVFKTLDSADLYKVPDDDLKAHVPFTDYSHQFQTLYEYGVETNDDELYNENFKILAPLWINRNLPDFFVVFRIDNPYNISSYSNVINDTELFKQFLTEGKCVKVFDMRESSPIGKYLHNYLNNINQYPGSILLQFKEQETDNDYDNGVNSWFGISVDSGLVVKKDEISYFANETINMNNQDKLNQFLVDGFERNRLLCPNLINLEWMFDDDGVENYKMNRYFGLYMKENDIITYDYVEQTIDQKTKNITLKKYDTEHNEIDDSLITGENSVLNDSRYEDRMFFGIGTKTFDRLKEPNDLNNFLRKEVISKPYKNYQTCNAVKIETTYKNFVTLNLQKPIKYGEHFRIVVPDFSIEGIESPVVFEFIASNDGRLANEIDAVSPFISVSNSRDTMEEYVYYRQRLDTPKRKNIPQKYYYRGIDTPSYKEKMAQFPVMNVVRAIQESNGRQFEIRGREINNEESGDGQSINTVTSTEITKYAYVFRMNFYTQDSIDNTKTATIGAQINRLASCVKAMEREFGVKIHVASTTNDSISIITGYLNPYFQHITADILNNDVVEIDSKKNDINKSTDCGVEDASLKTNFKDICYDKITSKDFGHDETIVYFGNKDLNIPLVPLDNKSDYYKTKAMMFSPVNFEILGWRKTSIVKFLTLEGYSYEIESDDVSKIIPNTIVRGVNGKYARLNDYLISSVEFDYSDSVRLTTDDIRFYENRITELDEIIEKLKEDYIQILTDDEKEQIKKDIEKYTSEKISIISYKDNLWEFIENRDKNSYHHNDSYINRVQSPYNLDKFIINSDIDIEFDGDYVSLYSSQSVNIALMGILPIKDFDSTIDYTETKSETNVIDFTIPANTSIYIDDMDAEYSIKSNTLYTLKTGKFKDIPFSAGSSFIIIDGRLYYNSSNKTKLNDFKFIEIKENRIITADIRNPVVKLMVEPYKVDINLTTSTPKLIEKYSYKDDNVLEDLKYSLVSPVVCNWRGVGCYFDHDSLLKIENILRPDYKNVSKGYFCTHRANTLTTNNDMFVENNLKDLVIDNQGNKVDFFSYVTESSITDTINMFLVKGKCPDYTVGYYNKYIDTLDFILYGIKFSLKFNSSDYVSSIQLQNYNKYEIYIINDYNGNKNDVIINTIENTILIVNHNFNFGSFDKKDNNYYTRGGELFKNKFYSWNTSDKYLNLDDTESDGNSVYIPVNTDTIVPKDVTCKKFVQLDTFDKNQYLYDNLEKNSLFYLDVSVLSSENMRIIYTDSKGNRFLFCDNGYVLVDSREIEDTSIIMTESFLKYPVDSEYLNNYVDEESRNVLKKTKFGFGSKIVSEHNSWLIDPEYANGNVFDLYTNESEKYDRVIEEYINTFREDDMNIYVKSQSTNGISVSKMETTPNFRPMSIETSLPKNVKYCIDFYNPNFKDVVSFYINETTDLIKKTKTNFTLSNTKFKSIERIKNYYGFKIFNKMSHNLENTTNMFVLSEKSLVSSNWDYQYYRNYSDTKKFTKIDGFLTGIEDKSFFGSKGLKLKKAEVFIENWGEQEIVVTNSNVSEYSTESANKTQGSKIILTINLHRVFYNHFLKSVDENFVSNWKMFNTDTDTAMNNFIKKSLINYFKINNRLNFKLYSTDRKYDSKFLLTKPSNFKTDFKEVTNFTSVYKKENNEVILEITLTDSTKTYYATYDFKSNL